jgi:hypothetical protein
MLHVVHARRNHAYDDAVRKRTSDAAATIVAGTMTTFRRHRSTTTPAG